MKSVAKTSLDLEFDLAQWFSEGLAVVRNADGWYFIDMTAATVLVPFSGALGFSSGPATVLDAEGRTGLRAEQG